MNKQNNISIIIFFILISQLHIAHAQSIKEQYPFSKVIIWGHKFHTKHTHGWIHWAFERAFTYLDYETLWLDNDDNIQNIDFSNSLFITEGQVDQRIPLRQDCRYILHNCDEKKYADLHHTNNCINLQVYTHKCTQENVEKIDNCIYQDRTSKYIYMPWATDLLPHEIEKNMQNISQIKKTNQVVWIGTIGAGIFGNINELNPFINAAELDLMEFISKSNVVTSMEDNQTLVQQSILAPAIVGTWQLKEGYIPCRIFKNISYGAMGVTNSKAAYDLFDQKIIYHENTHQLYYNAKEKIKSMPIEELLELMALVKEKHTYINRIEHLLKFIHLIKPLY